MPTAKIMSSNSSPVSAAGSARSPQRRFPQPQHEARMSPMPQFDGPIRVCVLTSSYEKSDSELKEFEGSVPMTPAYYFDKNDPSYTFTSVSLDKATVYSTVRALAKSGEYDVFFNLCDGAKDEDRAGEEVVRALEEFVVPFTASISKYYEISKPDMKMMAFYANIPTAKYAVLEATCDIAAECAHLSFPVIIKHISGYSSIGMTKDCKCVDMDSLVKRAKAFIGEYQFALVEEFVKGDEVTVLACADSSAADGVRVYQPVMVNFPPGDDFKHFQLKWECFEGMAWKPMSKSDLAYEHVIEVTRASFSEMMGGIGYGRVDLRIDRETNKAVFLEINPNCGIMYPPGQEGSADWILKIGDENGIDQHKDFTILQINEAIRRNFVERPLYRRAFSEQKGFYLKAIRSIPGNYIIFQDEGRMFRLATKKYVMKHWQGRDLEYFRHSSWPLGTDDHFYALWDTNPAEWKSFNHSCNPNMAFEDGNGLNVVATRDIAVGEELTMDYLTFMRPEDMLAFRCLCGASNCATFIPNRERVEEEERQARQDALKAGKMPAAALHHTPAAGV